MIVSLLTRTLFFYLFTTADDHSMYQVDLGSPNLSDLRYITRHSHRRKGMSRAIFYAHVRFSEFLLGRPGRPTGRACLLVPPSALPVLRDWPCHLLHPDHRAVMVGFDSYLRAALSPSLHLLLTWVSSAVASPTCRGEGAACVRAWSQKSLCWNNGGAAR